MDRWHGNISIKTFCYGITLNGKTGRDVLNPINPFFDTGNTPFTPLQMSDFSGIPLYTWTWRC